ncbi:MAG: TRAP transporter small permease [Lysobacter sp.]|nr:TRAP transporter small permease [Lysobacter sp.]
MSSSNTGPIAGIVDGYFKFLKFLIALCLLVMVILVFGNVFLRYAFNSGITISEELSRWFFVWMTFIGALVGLREHTHLGVDSLVNRLTPRGRRFCLVAAQSLMIYCSWILLQGSWQQTMINLEVAAPTSGLSLAFIYGIGVFFAINAIPILLADMYRVLSGKLSDHELIMVKESEESVHGDPHDAATAK